VTTFWIDSDGRRDASARRGALAKARGGEVLASKRLGDMFCELERVENDGILRIRLSMMSGSFGERVAP
jgi:hypothetical protein